MLRFGPLILRNVVRNRRRTILTLASMATSLGLLTLLVALYQAFFYGEPTTPWESRWLITRHRVSLAQPLPVSHLQRICTIPDVDAACGWTWFGGEYKDPKNNFARFAVDADRVFDVHRDWTMPDDQLVAFKHQRTACAVARAIAQQYGMKIGDRVTIVGDLYPVTLELTIAGIFEHPASAECLIFHRDYLTELLPTTSRVHDGVIWYQILISSPEKAPRISRAVDAMFENSPNPTRTETVQEFGRSFLAFLGNVKLFLMAICGAITFSIVLVSANTVAMAVRERTREMGVLRTLGYTPGEILQLVLGESIVISLLGGAAGIGLGYLLLKSLTIVTGFGAMRIRWQAATIVLGAAVIIGLFAALVPALTASRRNIVESIRFTG
jgi:putative ABC transport system permease protein